MYSFPKSWESVFEEVKKNIDEIAGVLSTRDWVPLPEDLYAALHRVPLDKVSVVIIGQDPYTPMIRIGDKVVPRATGFAFAQRRGDEVAPSLRNIYKEIQSNYPNFVIPDHGDITCWCDQGVLLLNSCLTVDKNGESGSHGILWEAVINRIIKSIMRRRDDCIYLLWGKSAGKVASWVGNKGIILTASHPSPISSAGFFGCAHFAEVNRILQEKQRPPIDWTVL